MRFLGVDYGTRRIGIAAGEDSGYGAYPIATLQRSRRLGHDLAEIARLAAREEADGIVVGLPLNADGSHGPAAEAASAFARSLAKHTPLPITLWDEFLTTAEAEAEMIAADVSRARRRRLIDQMAAVHLLEGFFRARREQEQARKQKEKQDG